MGLHRAGRTIASWCLGDRQAHSPDLNLVISDFAERTGWRTPDLITTDAVPGLCPLLMMQYGVLVEPPPTGLPGRPRQPYLEWPEGSATPRVARPTKRDR